MPGIELLTPRPRTGLPWVTLGILLAHVLEEGPGFPAWATLRFGTTTPAWFVLSHVPLVGVAAWVTVRAAGRRGPSQLWWWWVLQSALAANAVFHVVAAFWFGEYVPGIATAVALYLPSTVYIGLRVIPEMGGRRSALATGTGVLAMALIIATLWLEVPV